MLLQTFSFHCVYPEENPAEEEQKNFLFCVVILECGIDEALVSHATLAKYYKRDSALLKHFTETAATVEHNKKQIYLLIKSQLN